jgi:hypothetical protein
MDYMVSADDLRDVLGKDLRIIKFGDLKNYSSIKQLLPKKYDYIVIFYTNEMKNGVNIGHWTCLLRDGEKFEFFDPYGLKETEELKFIPKEKRRRFGEEVDYLKKLLEGTDHTFNKFDYQKWDDNVTTCGRWVYLKIFTFKNGIRSSEKFHSLVVKNAKRFNSFDEFVVWITSE